MANFFSPEAELALMAQDDGLGHLFPSSSCQSPPSIMYSAPLQQIAHRPEVNQTGSGLACPQPNDYRPITSRPCVSHDYVRTSQIPQTHVAYSACPPIGMSAAQSLGSHSALLPQPMGAVRPSRSHSASSSDALGIPPNSTADLPLPTLSRPLSLSSSSSDLRAYGYLNKNSTWSCAYPGCTSRAVFTRGCDLRKHYKRHAGSFLCRYKGCPQATGGGFSSKKDLARHELKHEPGVVCDWEGCDRMFTRVDNMRDHVKRTHLQILLSSSRPKDLARHEAKYNQSLCHGQLGKAVGIPSDLKTVKSLPKSIGRDTIAFARENTSQLNAIYESVNEDIENPPISQVKEEQSRNSVSNAFQKTGTTWEETEGSDRDEHPRHRDIVVESIELSPRTVNLDCLLREPPKHQQLSELQREDSINTIEECARIEDGAEVEIKEEQNSERSEESNAQYIESMGAKLPYVERVLSTALIQIKDFIFDGLVNYIVSEATDGSASPETRKRTRESSSSTLSSSSSSQSSDEPPRKRARSGPGGPGDNGDSGDDGDDNEKPPKRNGKSLPLGLPNRRLKCPFYQREPEKYARAACRGEGFADMAKLKDHIKRVHTQPLRCSRCWKEMTSDGAYATHLQAEIICDKQQEPADERLPYHMLKRLDFKKAPYAQAKNTEQKWKILYSLLFPNDTEIPSPYDQHCLTPRLQRVLHEALEEELTRRIAPAVEPIILQIKEQIPAIIQNCKLRLLQAYSDSATSNISSRLATSGKTNLKPDSQLIRSDHKSQTTSPPDSGTAGSSKFWCTAQSKRIQYNGHSPSSSSTDRFQESRHASSPGSIFDCRSILSDPVCITQENQADGSGDSFPTTLLSSPRTVRAEEFDDLCPFSGGYTGTQIGAYTSKSLFEGENTQPTAKGTLQPRNEALALNPDHISTNLDIPKEPLPVKLNSVTPSHLYISSHRATDDGHTYPELQNSPPVLNFDCLFENLDFEKFFE